MRETERDEREQGREERQQRERELNGGEGETKTEKKGYLSLYDECFYRTVCRESSDQIIHIRATRYSTNCRPRQEDRETTAIVITSLSLPLQP